MPATDKVSGENGAVSQGGVAIAITRFQFNETSEAKNVTDSTSGGKTERIPGGIVDFVGSFEGWVLDGTVTPVVGGAAAEFIFTAETGLTWTGDAIITSKSVEAQIEGGDAVKWSCDFEGTGGLTEANV